MQQSSDSNIWTFRKFLSYCIPGYLRFVLLLLFLCSAGEVSSQNDKKAGRWFDQARQFFSGRSYDQARDLCFRVLERDSDYVDAYLLLADIFRETGEGDRELDVLEKAASLTGQPLVFYRLGTGYYSVGNYTGALENFQKYLEDAPAGTKRVREVERKVENCRFALTAMKHPVEFQPERLPGEVNSAYDEYWPSLTLDGRKLVFTRLIKKQGQVTHEDFFVSNWDSASWTPAEALKELNTPDNEGAQSLSGDGRWLFFTACNRPGGMGSCDIYYSVQENGRWSRPVNAGPPVNTRGWEAQPSIAADGRTLYFSSNREGGKGGKDIWFVRCKGPDEYGRLRWGTPVNAGDSINTPGNEISPFIHAGNRSFYFASDFHTGMGGFDLFMADVFNDSLFSGVRNLGYPLNTFNDEQGLFVNTGGQKAFFASARHPGTGLDIYSFTLDESIRPEPATYVNALVIDSLTGTPLKAQIELVDLTHDIDEPRRALTDTSGKVLLCLPSGAEYAFSVSKEGYLFFSDAFDLSESRNFYDPYELVIRLKPLEVGAEMDLYNIYFETDSFAILPHSEPELQKLVRFLQNNSGLVVEIQGHTDNTGSKERNRELSVQRARSVVDYLTRNGIDLSRLAYAGYGESRPVASNETPDGRRKNRRTTIKILDEQKP